MTINTDVKEAFFHLLDCRISELQITKHIMPETENYKTGYYFECDLKIEDKNKKSREISLKVCLPEDFHYQELTVYVKTLDYIGYQHQTSEKGKICLPDEKNFPRNKKRLVEYIKATINWLKDAINGEIVKKGDHYELPDFQTDSDLDSITWNYRFYFNETNESFNIWEKNFEASGKIICQFDKTGKIYLNKWFNKNKTLLYEQAFSKNILSKDSIEGIWILLKNVLYTKHRPPLTFQELNEICQIEGIDIYKVIKDSWKIKNKHGLSFILIGFPFPEKYGEPNKEIHWQPIIFPNYKKINLNGVLSQNKEENLEVHTNQDIKELYRNKFKKDIELKTHKTNKIFKNLKENYYFNPEKKIPWGYATNISHERLFIRSHYSKELQDLKISVIGAGAIGSLLCDLLVRGGIKNLNIFDPELLDYGNLCRHTLDGKSVGKSKASKLAERLSFVNPLANIDGFSCKIPLKSTLPEDYHNALLDSDLIIDCSANEAVIKWLNEYSLEKNKRLISLFIDLNADLLTLGISGKKTSCLFLLDDLKDQVMGGELQFLKEKYLSTMDEIGLIVEGPGCWHPTFPALNNHINILVATGIDIISNQIKNTDAFSVILKRNEINLLQPGSIVEILWSKNHP